MDLQETLNLQLAEPVAKALLELYVLLQTTPKACLSYVEGGAYGGGAGLALACDFSIAGRGAQIAFPEIQKGIIPAFIVGLQKVPPALLLSGRPVKPSQLLNASGGETLALTVAEQFLQMEPHAFAATKQLLSQGLRARLEALLPLHIASKTSVEAQQCLKLFLN